MTDTTPVPRATSVLIRGEYMLDYYRTLPESVRSFARWAMVSRFPTGIKTDALYPVEAWEELKRKIDTYQSQFSQN